MHELSMAEGLIDHIILIANENKISRINEIIIHAGELRLIIPEVMQEAFRAVSEGTLAEKAVLIIEEVPAQARCNDCEKVFHPEINDFSCPECQKADVTIQKGNDIILTSISGDTHS